jgi:hypothetical protein
VPGNPAIIISMPELYLNDCIPENYGWRGVLTS